MKIRRNPSRKTAGTLVEVMVAVSVLAIMIAGILNSFGYGFFITKLARENQRATQIILEQVETIRLYSWDQINSNGFIPNQTWTLPYDPSAPTNQQGTLYTGLITITNCPWANTNLRTVTINLSWTTSNKVPHNRSFTTFVGKDGIQNYIY
jgi:type II secretory pathway pseudopilin PulG